MIFSSQTKPTDHKKNVQLIESKELGDGGKWMIPSPQDQACFARF